MRNLGPRWLRRALIALLVLVVVGGGIIAGFVATYGLDTNTRSGSPPVEPGSSRSRSKIST